VRDNLPSDSPTRRGRAQVRSYKGHARVARCSLWERTLCATTYGAIHQSVAVAHRVRSHRQSFDAPAYQRYRADTVISRGYP
jgi:hypothetical protein